MEQNRRNRSPPARGSIRHGRQRKAPRLEAEGPHCCNASGRSAGAYATAATDIISTGFSMRATRSTSATSVSHASCFAVGGGTGGRSASTFAGAVPLLTAPLCCSSPAPSACGPSVASMSASGSALTSAFGSALESPSAAAATRGAPPPSRLAHRVGICTMSRMRCTFARSPERRIATRSPGTGKWSGMCCVAVKLWNEPRCITRGSRRHAMFRHRRLMSATISRVDVAPASFSVQFRRRSCHSGAIASAAESASATAIVSRRSASVVADGSGGTPGAPSRGADDGCRVLPCSCSSSCSSAARAGGSASAWPCAQNRSVVAAACRARRACVVAGGSSLGSVNGWISAPGSAGARTPL